MALWKINPSLIADLVSDGMTGLEEIVIVTTDANLPSLDGDGLPVNVNIGATYFKHSGTKYYASDFYGSSLAVGTLSGLDWIHSTDGNFSMSAIFPDNPFGSGSWTLEISVSAMTGYYGADAALVGGTTVIATKQLKTISGITIGTPRAQLGWPEHTTVSSLIPQWSGEGEEGTVVYSITGGANAGAFEISGDLLRTGADFATIGVVMAQITIEADNGGTPFEDDYEIQTYRVTDVSGRLVCDIAGSAVSGNILVSSNPPPQGMLFRSLGSGQKRVVTSPGTAPATFDLIPSTVDVGWGWAAAAEYAWAVLQSK
jgi:hypothetical protein